MPDVRCRHRWFLVLALSLAAVVGACASEGQATQPPQSSAARPTDQPLATVPSDPTLAAALGPWRRVPFQADPAFGVPFVAGCRGVEAAIGSMRAVVVDVRGRGWITVLFASETAAFLCRTTVDDPTHPLEVRAVAVPGGSVTGDQIDLALWTPVRIAPETITYAVGRVGPEPAEVIGVFNDQSFVYGTHQNGWWVAWWPPQPPIDGFSAVDHSHLVLNHVAAPASGEFPEASAGASP